MLIDIYALQDQPTIATLHVAVAAGVTPPPAVNTLLGPTVATGKTLDLDAHPTVYGFGRAQVRRDITNDGWSVVGAPLNP